MSNADLFSLSRKVISFLQDQGEKIITVESCTGGMIAASLTDIAGSSAVVEGGLVTYSNTLKQVLVGVSGATLEHYGAVSEQTAQEMAEGALYAVPTATLALSVTGIAGPGGGSAYKPVGTVCFALAAKGKETRVQRCFFSGDRRAIRHSSVCHALQMLLSL
ncbi:CinA family protein [Neokomagataea anthophila]|uniref:Nicotinamide-nucleotide amidohydrolase family protein n=1 Tax=Neokomagataea anthophila TaxID=2826925 RepID=A0ABS5E7B6_9PROT|nr:nicotinamide-nucleotide amidohydrolase family protein [Neokomagataea anthophila]MBR0559696.1 nicotinamide-nucleotide amidohydrolase family protein [Neokomagataea anthophila]